MVFSQWLETYPKLGFDVVLGLIATVHEWLLCVRHSSTCFTFVIYPVKVNIPIFQKKVPKFTEEVYLRLNY